METATRPDPPTREESLTQTVDALPRLSPRGLRNSVEAAGAGPGRYLTVEDGGERRLIPLSLGIMSVGRGFSVDVRLDDESVSRRHALLAVRAHGARILDDRSANGTHVNGRRVTEADLTDGDVIVLGRVVLSYVEIA
jgi:pSer/pThr/pTyr-binding forkhead associated (FHA) protein